MSVYYRLLSVRIGDTIGLLAVTCKNNYLLVTKLITATALPVIPSAFILPPDLLFISLLVFCYSLY